MRSKRPSYKPTAVESGTVFSALYGDGLTASRVAAKVTLEADGLLVKPVDASAVLWPYADIRAAEPIRYRTLDAVLMSAKAERASLYVDDTFLLALLAQRSPHLRLGAERWRAAWPGLAVGATALAAYAAIWAFDISPTKGIARAMPNRARTVLGDSVIRTMPSQRVCTGSEGRAALGKLTRRLMPKGPITADDVIVLDWSLINAFAVPGNRVVLTRALIEQAKGPDEIAAVLGHEAGHVIELHPEASLVRSVGFWALVQMVFTGTPGAIGNIGVVLAQLGYTRSAEREADGHALRLLREAHISPKPMGDFFRRMDQRAPSKGSNTNAVSDILSSHPSNPERVARIESEPAYPSSPALTEADWNAFKTICSATETGAPSAARPAGSSAQTDADAARKQAAAEASRLAEAKEAEQHAAEQARIEAARKQADAAAATAAAVTAKLEAAKAKADADRADAQRRQAEALEAARAQAAKETAAKEQLARLEVARKEVGRIDDAIAAAEKAQPEKGDTARPGPTSAAAAAPVTSDKPRDAKSDEGASKQVVAAATGAPAATTPKPPAGPPSADSRIGDANRKIALNAADTAALIERGQALAAKKDWAGALEDFSRSLAIKPRDGNTLFWRAAMHAQLGHIEQAINDYSDVIRLQPRNFAAFNNRGSLYRAQKKLELALNDYTVAIAIDSRQAVALTNRALIHRERNNLDLALGDLNAAIAANPSYTNAYVRRGETQELRSQRDAAIADYRAVLRFPEPAGSPSEPHTTARARLTALGVKY